MVSVIRFLLSFVLVILLACSLFGPANMDFQFPVLIAATIIIITLMFMISFEKDRE